MRSGTIARRVAVAAAALTVVLPVGTASAGRVLVTGHDADHHCGRDNEHTKRGQCDFFRSAVDFARGGAPDPTKPVLVLDRASLDVVSSLDRAYGPGVVPRVVVEPRSEAFATLPLTTDAYSAIVIASSGGSVDATPRDLNEMTSTPDSDAINRRARDILAFFDQGGGIYANAGDVHGDGPGDPYYGFLPLTVRSSTVAEPFRLTDAGRAIGLLDADVNCCATHNAFEAPGPDSAWRAAETDRNGQPVTLMAETARASSLAEPPVTPGVVRQVSGAMPSTRQCVPRRSITLRVKKHRRYRYSRATVYMNGKAVKRLRGARITRPIKVRMPAAKRTAKVRIAIVTTSKRKITVRRTYKSCM